MTALGRSPQFYLSIIFVILLFLPLFLQRSDGVQLTHNGRPIIYETVATPQLRHKGLSGRASLPSDRAMLFVFEQSGRHCFWMKGMQFPIDIIWLDKNKEVVHIKQNVTPESYPESFCPTQDARYVVEANAGLASGLKVGQRLDIQ